jgi:predicted sulfurtransferase
MPTDLVAALYNFARLDAIDDLRARLFELCDAQQVKGTLLLAST